MMATITPEQFQALIEDLWEIVEPYLPAHVAEEWEEEVERHEAEILRPEESRW